MEVINTKIFQIDDSLVRDVYQNHDNYEIVYEEGAKVHKDLCVIYFSSNEIYYPNTPLSFQRSILNKNKYEWRNNTFPNGHKHIFVRDIQKQWYVEGINKELDTPEKVAELLRSLTQNFRVYTIGSSAGGFAAMLFGSLLNAERIYAFNAQLNLNIIMRDSTPLIDPVLFKYAQSPERAVYFKIENFVLPTVEYYYFQSCKSVMDIQQYKSFGRKELITRIPFKTANHGFPFLRHNLRHVLNLPDKDLKEMAKEEIHPFIFAVHIDGFFKTTYMVTSAILNRLKKKFREKRES